MQLRRTGLLVLGAISLLVLWSTPATAGTWWIPAAAHAGGAEGSVWRTDLQLHCFGASNETVTLTLLRQGADNSSLAETTAIPVPAGETVEVADVLQTLFSFTGTAALKVDAGGDELVVSSRTYNASAAGTFGQSIPGVPAGGVLTAGEPAYLLGLDGTNGQRTNLGWVSTSAEEITVHIELYDGSGTLLDSDDLAERPYGQSQINNIFSHFRMTPVSNAYAVVRADGPIQPYASVVAGGSNDPIYVAAQQAIDMAPDLLLPAVVHADGAEGTSWRSDLWLLNRGIGTAEVTLELWRQGQANPSPQTVTVEVAAGQQLALSDVVLEQLGRTGMQGALAIRSDGLLLATSRTYNTAPAGTYGQFIPPRSLAALAGAGETLYLAGAADNDDFRSNLGLVTSGSGGRVDLVLRSADGQVLASKRRTLGANEQQQLGIANLFGVADISSCTIEATLVADKGTAGTEAGSSGLAAYLSVVDRASSDPTFNQAARGYGDDPQLDNLDETTLSLTYALSQAVELSGPRAIGKDGCVDVDYDGDTIFPGQSPVDKCWQAAITFADCSYTFPMGFGSISQTGEASADVCITDGYTSTLAIDLETEVNSTGLGTLAYAIESLLGLAFEFDGSRPESAHLTGEIALDLNGFAAEAWVDLVWQAELVGFEFIPVGTIRLLLPYPDLVPLAVEVVVKLDGSEWVYIHLRAGFFELSMEVNIWTGEVHIL